MKMDVKTQRRFTPTLSQSNPYTVKFPVGIAAPSSVDRIVTSNLFRLFNQDCRIRNKLNSNVLEVVSVSTDLTVVTNVGTYNSTGGTVNLVGFAPDGIVGSATEIKISATPANQSTIRPLRNFILSLDTVASFSAANIDYERIKVNL